MSNTSAARAAGSSGSMAPIPEDEARHCREVAMNALWGVDDRQDLDWEQRAKTNRVAAAVARERAAAEERINALAGALCDVLHAAGVTNTVPVSIPEMLMAAKDFASRHRCGGSDG